MRYYIVEFVNINDDGLNNLHKTEILSKRLLTDEGLYKMNGDDLWLYKLMDNGSFAINNYIENYTLAGSNHYWKKTKKSYRIPIHNKIQTIVVEIYKHSPKSNTKFIIEKNNNKIIDFFFESKENPDNLSLKEDIASFLSLLMLS